MRAEHGRLIKIKKDTEKREMPNAVSDVIANLSLVHSADRYPNSWRRTC